MASRRKSCDDPGRGEETRRRLLEAGIDVFGRHGYEASTRELAAAAGVNLAMIPYHFGSKQGLYLATADYIAEQVLERLGPALAEAHAHMGDAAPTRAQASQLLCTVLEAYAHMLLAPESASWARFIIREQMAPTAAFERLYGHFIDPGFTVLSALVARVMGKRPTTQAVRLRTLALLGQVLMLRAANATVMREMGWSRLGARELGAVCTALRESVAALGLHATAGGTR